MGKSVLISFKRICWACLKSFWQAIFYTTEVLFDRQSNPNPLEHHSCFVYFTSCKRELTYFKTLSKTIRMLTIKPLHTNACLDAWLNCENLLAELQSIKKFLSNQVVKIVDECAYICLGTFHALKTGSVNSKNMALLCVGICEECADICELQRGVGFEQCAKVCRECANSLSDFTLAA